MASLEQIGTVTTRSGGLIVIDTGYLGIWSHDAAPLMPEGSLDTEEQTGRASSFVDLRLVADAERAGQLPKATCCAGALRGRRKSGSHRITSKPLQVDSALTKHEYPSLCLRTVNTDRRNDESPIRSTMGAHGSTCVKTSSAPMMQRNMK
jgi:hypothetical protein